MTVACARGEWYPGFALQFSRAAGGLSQFPVAMARGKHLFPFRTEKLSPSAPMVLGSQGPGRVGRRRFTSSHEPSRGAARRISAALPPDRGQAVLAPRHPCTGPARSESGTQRRAVRVRRLAAGHARPGELRVLQEDEGACECGGTPQGGMNGERALPASVERGEHAFAKLRRPSDGTCVRARDLAESHSAPEKWG